MGYRVKSYPVLSCRLISSVGPFTYIMIWNQNQNLFLKLLAKWYQIMIWNHFWNYFWNHIARLLAMTVLCHSMHDTVHGELCHVNILHMRLVKIIYLVNYPHRAMRLLTMWCRLWRPALLLHARPWWPFGCTLAPQMHVCGVTFNCIPVGRHLIFEH